MKYLTTITGLTENEIKELYLAKISFAKSIGLSENESRKIVQDSFRLALKIRTNPFE